MRSKQRNPAIISGRNIGTYTEWDEMDFNVIVICDFIPNEGVNLIKGDLIVAYDSGYFQIVNDAGDTLMEVDIIETLKGISRE